jgi:hypothetical protein
LLPVALCFGINVKINKAVPCGDTELRSMSMANRSIGKPDEQGLAARFLRDRRRRDEVTSVLFVAGEHVVQSNVQGNVQGSAQASLGKDRF